MDNYQRKNYRASGAFNYLFLYFTHDFKQTNTNKHAIGLMHVVQYKGGSRTGAPGARPPRFEKMEGFFFVKG